MLPNKRDYLYHFRKLNGKGRRLTLPVFTVSKNKYYTIDSAAYFLSDTKENYDSFGEYKITLNKQNLDKQIKRLLKKDIAVAILEPVKNTKERIRLFWATLQEYLKLTKQHGTV